MVHLLAVFACVLLQSDETVEKNDWVLIAPPGVGAVIEMPAVPKFVEQKMKPVRDRDEITVRSRSAVVDDGNANFTFVYHDERDIAYHRDLKNAILDGAMAGAIALVNGELLEQEDIFIDQNKGRDFFYTCEIDDLKLQTVHNLKVRSRVVLVGRRLFSMSYIAMADSYDEATATRYFESFKLVGTTPGLPPAPRLGRAQELAAEK